MCVCLLHAVRALLLRRLLAAVLHIISPPWSAICQVVVRELPKHWYKFLTTTCAIVGGVFTVAGLLDGILHTSLATFRKKVELGKQG